ncbi:MAG TPA: hypothetical protein VLX85_01145 [Stellaceae bacterium]|nr:hypothetical protein [Stellaceae bacterium]
MSFSDLFARGVALIGGAAIQIRRLTLGHDRRSLLMADDVGNVIWRVTANEAGA